MIRGRKEEFGKKTEQLHNPETRADIEGGGVGRPKRLFLTKISPFF